MKKVIIEIQGLSFPDKKELLSTTEKVFSYNYDNRVTLSTFDVLKRLFKNSDNFIYLRLLD